MITNTQATINCTVSKTHVTTILKFYFFSFNRSEPRIRNSLGFFQYQALLNMSQSPNFGHGERNYQQEIARKLHCLEREKNEDKFENCNKEQQSEIEIAKSKRRPVRRCEGDNRSVGCSR